MNRMNYIAAFNLMGLIQIIKMPSFYKIPNISSNRFRLVLCNYKIILITPSKEKEYYTDPLDTRNIGIKATIFKISIIMHKVINNEKTRLMKDNIKEISLC